MTSEQIKAEIAKNRAQILADQKSGAKRSEEAQETEREWYRTNRGKK